MQVDLDERSETWRSEGWAGVPSSTATAGAAAGLAGATATQRGNETIEVMEENVKVGKRDVSHGRVRVRSYVVEDQVSEDVTLHSEHVDVERRPVDRKVGHGTDAFQDSHNRSGRNRGGGCGIQGSACNGRDRSEATCRPANRNRYRDGYGTLKWRLTTSGPAKAGITDSPGSAVRAGILLTTSLIEL